MGGASQDDGVSHIRLFRNRGSSGLILYDYHLSGNCTRPPVIVSHLIESPPFQCFHGLDRVRNHEGSHLILFCMCFITSTSSLSVLESLLSLNIQLMIVPNRQLISTDLQTVVFCCLFSRLGCCRKEF